MSPVLPVNYANGRRQITKVSRGVIENEQSNPKFLYNRISLVIHKRKITVNMKVSGFCYEIHFHY
jgi:hypothetical protein